MNRGIFRDAELQVELQSIVNQTRIQTLDKAGDVWQHGRVKNVSWRN
jgi:hypothetical protein